MVHRRTLVGAAALAVVLAACSATSTSSTATTAVGTAPTATLGAVTTLINGQAYDASPFCVNARLAEALDQATQDVDATDTELVKKVYDASFAVAKDNAANAPASLKADYDTYVKWLTLFNTGLAGHGYRVAETLTDEQLVKAADDQKTKAASEKVNTYKQTVCGIGIPVATTSSSADTVAP